MGTVRKRPCRTLSRTVRFECAFGRFCPVGKVDRSGMIIHAGFARFSRRGQLLECTGPDTLRHIAAATCVPRTIVTMVRMRGVLPVAIQAQRDRTALKEMLPSTNSGTGRLCFVAGFVGGPGGIPVTRSRELPASQ